MRFAKLIEQKTTRMIESRRAMVSAIQAALCFSVFLASVNSMAQAKDPSASIPTPPEQDEAESTFDMIGVGGYSRPLRFAPEDNGLSIDNPQLKWIFENDNVINISGFRINGETIRFHTSQTEKAPTSPDQNDRLSTHISMQWPAAMAKSGKLSIETLDGKTRYVRNFNDRDADQWKNALGSKENKFETHLASIYGRFDIPKKGFSFLWRGGKYRSCFSRENSKLERLKICSAPFESSSKGDSLSVTSITENAEPMVYIDGKPIGKRGILNFKVGTPFILKIQFKSGSFVEVVTQPEDLGLLDVIESKDGNEVILTGHGAQPFGRVEYIAKPVTHFWAPTGITQDKIWRIAIPRDVPTLRVTGTFNIIFTMLFAFDRLPKESDRVYIRRTRSSGTYSASPVIYGLVPPDTIALSEENSATMTGGRQFEWNFASPKKGEDNRSHLIVKRPGTQKPWVSHHNMFRSYPFEMSGRLTGIISEENSMILLGELSTGYWFESLGFTQNSLLSKQRWGLTGRYFKALSAIKTSSGQSVDDLSVFNSDLKYNLVPGIWHRDELVGLMASIQYIQLMGTATGLWGFGGYWARTMPKVFDDLFNLLPLMNYPKYVDMEFIYFPLALTDGIRAGASWNLNFHGRVFWMERFYGEAGFGAKSWEYAETSAPNRSVSLTSIYGTAGLGFLF